MTAPTSGGLTIAAGARRRRSTSHLCRGPSKLIEEILAHPLLEALPATIEQGITANSDVVIS